MSYRKLDVDGQVFEYSVGRTHTKIRGVGAFQNEKVGKILTQIMFNDLTNEFETESIGVQVRPSDLSDFIKRNRLKAPSVTSF
jgi:hypothetical protein